VPTPKPEAAPPTPTQPPTVQRSLTVPPGDTSSRASVTSDEDRSDIGSESYDSDATYDRFAFLLDPTPTSDQLNSMGLRLGSNTIQFDVYSGSGRSQKRSTVTSKIFVWTPRSRVVISDIDGTITKSDILGHIYYYIGRDWTHNGVAKLFTMIKVVFPSVCCCLVAPVCHASQRVLQRHGYEIMYLTSRAIGQSDSTRQYLQSVKQEGDASLPAGPVITSPDRLIAAFTREVIHRKPHEFKIECLKSIRRLFPANRNPFYAGFGNRDTDMLSYREAGVNPGKIFLINPKARETFLVMTWFCDA
jgi:phosphatidate phosphatase LPIN